MMHSLYYLKEYRRKDIVDYHLIIFLVNKLT